MWRQYVTGRRDAPMRVALGCVVLTWLLVSVGGVMNPGYRQYEQYLSALSATGTTAPAWGRAALVAVALGIAVLVPRLTAWRVLPGAAAAAAAAGAVGMALIPMPCPDTADFCQAAGAPPATAHVAAVLFFAAAIVTLALSSARQLAAGGRSRPSLWPALPSAVVLVAFAAPVLLQVTGLPQRTLLLTAQLIVVAAAVAAGGELSRRRRRAAATPARRVIHP